MSDYSTNLRDWGSKGEQYPEGYSYEDKVPPVDVYDNNAMYNIIKDIQHLINLTNDRIESDKGPAGSEPSSPEGAHFYYDTDNEVLKVWNESTDSWVKVASREWVSTTKVGDADSVDGWDKADIKTWVNNNADVPNADHSDQTTSFQVVSQRPDNPDDGEVWILDN